jgi:putative lipoic acid-binding regulatory protein
MKIGPQRELLEAIHEFPGAYTLKAFGPPGATFLAEVTSAAESVHSGDEAIEVSSRESSGGRHACVTVTIRVECADDVFAFYSAVRGIDGLSMLL